MHYVSAHPWILAAVLVVVCLGVLHGCSFYNHAYPASQSPSNYDLKLVQIDDFGSFWDSTAAQEALTAVMTQSESLTSSTYVALFIHGWHNNAAPNNGNLIKFNHFLAQLSTELSLPERRATRQELTGSPDFKLIGIYIGWRGRSMPGILDYGTMWWRKAAAERVGYGDLSEFLERLQRYYLRANAYQRYQAHPGQTPFTGLFTIGHSFGGQALLAAAGRPMEEQLAERAPIVTNAVAPTPTTSQPTVVTTPIDSFGDLNVLVNPATEAYQFSRIDFLYRQLAFSSRQTPQLTIFSADNDSARQSFFPIARALTSPFRPRFRNSYQGALFGKALGEFVPQRTHELNKVTSEADSLNDNDFKPENRDKVANWDFTGATVFSGAKLTRLPNVPAIANSPISVIYTHDKIIDGHNGVFDQGFLDFLTKYVAYIEGKRIVSRFRQFEAQKARDDTAAPSAAPAVASPSSLGSR
jgi:hypothetical protein